MTLLKKLRTDKGIALTDAAIGIGISKQRLSQMEKGEGLTKEPIIRKIAIYYGMNLFDIFGEQVLRYKPKTQEEKNSLLKIVSEIKIEEAE